MATWLTFRDRPEPTRPRMRKVRHASMARRQFIRSLCAAVPVFSFDQLVLGLPLGVRFVDVAREAGLKTKTIFGGERKNEFLMETTGCGCAFLDYDNDGWLDIFLVNGTRFETDWKSSEAPVSRLYKNNRDGTCSGRYGGGGSRTIAVSLAIAAAHARWPASAATGPRPPSRSRTARAGSATGSRSGRGTGSPPPSGGAGSGPAHPVDPAGRTGQRQAPTAHRSRRSRSSWRPSWRHAMPALMAQTSRSERDLSATGP